MAGIKARIGWESWREWHKQGCFMSVLQLTGDEVEPVAGVACCNCAVTRSSLSASQLLRVMFILSRNSERAQVKPRLCEEPQINALQPLIPRSIEFSGGRW
ncbi:hypothetical protein WH50_00290 [Pokkaliibacter plantistimulans]|uniref:Uncharacterized protein n=1 Tax=Pokkaliibacter plantistimulans TaxID=1635171 RepID=A0ABX5M3V5_9GAMM|nr:hypothetical protein WH50_00290 [Pokkaliibacter plantistimulans]